MYKMDQAKALTYEFNDDILIHSIQVHASV